MKRFIPLFLLSAAVTVISALAFVNNVYAIVHWWQAFIAAGGDSAGIPAHAPGVISWLDWSSVDYSAVTTLIPFLGFLCMTVALWRLVRGKRMRAGDFPFFRGSDQLNVALGLFGTLWGIIVIGYFKLDTVSMADLMQCLHTALFSTLTAVVWVFMIDRPLVRPWFTRMLERAGLAETDDGDLAAAVDRLVVRLGVASDAFDRRQQEYEASFEKRRSEYAAHFEERLAKYEKDFERRQAEYNDFFRRRIAELEKRAEEERATAAALKARLDSVANALR